MEANAGRGRGRSFLVARGNLCVARCVMLYTLRTVIYIDCFIGLYECLSVLFVFWCLCNLKLDSCLALLMLGIL